MRIARTFARGVAWISLLVVISSVAGYFSKYLTKKRGPRSFVD
ncbi:MAG: hypothetical protein ABH874_00070 [Methanobacteriota archaeon]